IQTIRVGSSGFDPEFAEPARGRVEIITKVDSEKYSGDLSVDYNDDRLNATNPLATTRATGRERTLNGSIRGPIVGGLWAFEISGEHSDRYTESIVNATVLNPATFMPVPSVSSVASPQSTRSIGFRTDYQPTPAQRLTLAYTEEQGSSDNQGLST